MTDTDQPLTPDISASEAHGEAASNRYELLIRTGFSSRTITLEARSYTVGRSEECDVRLADPAVSRRHLLLEPRHDGAAFRDLGGTNGTLWNGIPKTEGLLSEKDELLLGETRLRLRSSAESGDVRIMSSEHATAVLALAPIRSTPSNRDLSGRDLSGRDLSGRDLHGQSRPVRDASTTDPGAQVVQTLDVLGWGWTPPEDISESAARLLRAALQLTGRTRGLIGLFANGSPLRVLATEHPDGLQPIEVSRSILERARTERVPLLVQLDKGPRDTDSARPVEQIVAPFGPEADGVLVLQAALPMACSGRTALEIAASFGTIAARELAAVRANLATEASIRQLRYTHSAGYQSLVAAPRLSTARGLLTEAARSRLPVRLLAEEGTEREELARLYHLRSDHAAGPFIAYYCGLVSSSLAAARLLHDDREASGRDGLPLIERAVGGTLFLDAPERLDAATQKRLAQALQEQRRRTLAAGDIDPARSANDEPVAGEPPALVVAETRGGDLTPELAALFDGPTIGVPALREHPEDVHAAVEATLLELGPAENQARSLTERALGALRQYDWPGNVRQLQRVVLAAAGQCSGPEIDVRHLPAEVRDVAEKPQRLETLLEVERRQIVAALAHTSGNRARAAQILGIASSTLYDKIRRHGLANG